MQEKDLDKIRLDISSLTIPEMMFLYYFCVHNVTSATGTAIGEWLGEGRKVSAVNGLKLREPPVVYSLGKTSIRKPTHKIFNIWKFNHESYDFQMLKVDLHNRLVELKKSGALD